MLDPMTALPAVAHVEAPARPPKGGERAATDFGGAMSYREMVATKLRVDPVSLAEKKRQADPTRKRDAPPPREEHYEEPGSRLDISV